MENNKAAEAASNSAGGATTGQSVNGNGGVNPDPSTIPNPKLGMAPLSSELAVAAASNNVPAESHQPSNPPLPGPLQPTDPPNTRASIPPTIDPPRPDSTTADPSQVPKIPAFSELNLEVPRTNDPPPSPLPDSTALPTNPTPTVDLAEQAHPPNPNPTPLDPPPADLPTDTDSQFPKVDGAPEGMS